MKSLCCFLRRGSHEPGGLLSRSFALSLPCSLALTLSLSLSRSLSIYKFIALTLALLLSLSVSVALSRIVPLHIFRWRGRRLRSSSISPTAPHIGLRRKPWQTNQAPNGISPHSVLRKIFHTGGPEGNFHCEPKVLHLFFRKHSITLRYYLQGCLAHEKHHPPGTLQYDFI